MLNRNEVIATFALYPEAAMVCMEMGQGYGRSRHAGRCPLTGVWLPEGTPGRMMTLALRDGTKLSGWMSHPIVKMFEFHGGCEKLDDGTQLGSISEWVRCAPGWEERLAEAPEGTAVSVMKINNEYGGEPAKTWGRSARGWERGFTAVSTKQPQASMRRGRGARFYKIEAPYEVRGAARRQARADYEAKAQ